MTSIKPPKLMAPKLQAHWNRGFARGLKLAALQQPKQASKPLKKPRQRGNKPGPAALPAPQAPNPQQLNLPDSDSPSDQENEE